MQMEKFNFFNFLFYNLSPSLIGILYYLFIFH